MIARPAHPRTTTAQRWIVGAVASTTLAAGCSDEMAEPELTRTEYVQRLTDVCVVTTARLDERPEPLDATEVTAFAEGVADDLGEEADLARELRPPDELDADHRAFVRNTDDQAARWRDLAATSSTDPAFADITREIGQLALGRNDLSVEMGVPDCVRSPS